MGQISLSIDDDLHRKARAEAQLAGVRWYPWIEQAIREKLDRDKAAREAQERK